MADAVSGPMTSNRLFIAGATGATGQVLVPLAASFHLEVIPHVRPKSVHKLSHPHAAVFELTDAQRLRETLQTCDTVVSLVGTMRKRFGQGDTYETSDIGTTRLLVNAAKEVGLRHFILLSSVGAGKPFGAYLRAKAQAENLVMRSGLAYTVFRPSALEGGERKAIPFAKPLFRALGLRRLEPISLHDVSSAILWCAKNHAPLHEVLEGRSLWKLVDEAQRGVLEEPRQG